MKKLISAVLAIVMAAGMAACSADLSGKKGLSIVTTIFPEYDWVNNILGENPAGAEVTLLMHSGVDLHSYQPSAEDALKVSGCDVFIYVGGESDKWVDDMLRSAVNKNMVVVNLMDVLKDSVVEEEEVEGMQEEEHEEGEEEETEYDEHVWLSLKNAQAACDAIADAIKKVDSANASVYDSNLASYKDKIGELDSRYKSAVESCSKDTLVFGDRFPFRYLVDDYSIKYYAAFPGCSADSEASFDTIIFLAEKVEELGLKYVITIDGNDGRIAKSIIDSTKSKDQQTLRLNSLQSISDADLQNGVSYLSVMESNLEVISEALK